jgi:hypothetical protein
MRYNEIVNFPLWKKLPYDIRLTIYVAVNFYNNKKIDSGFHKVVNDIKTNEQSINDIVCKLTMLNNGYEIMKTPLGISVYSASYRPMIDIDYSFSDDIRWDKKIKKLEYDVKNFKRRHFYYGTDIVNNVTRKIHFNSKDIRDIYGNIVWIYYKSKDNKWVRFQRLPFAMSFPINRFDLYNHILISNVDALDESLNVNSTVPIIFEFKFSELLTLDFKFRRDNFREVKHNLTHLNMFI